MMQPHSATSVGETPVVAVTGRRFALDMFSAVSPRRDIRFMAHAGSVTAPVFKDLLSRMRFGAARPVFVVVDGHPIHKSRLVREFV